METVLIGAGILAALLVIPRFLGVRKMPAGIVKQKIDAGALIIDVRTPEEFRDGAYPGARNIPISNLGARLGELPREKPVVLYCASGARSAAAARALKQAGFTDVINAGGLADMP
jgi:phage shock protein E